MDTQGKLKSSQLYFLSFTAILVLLPWSIALTNYAIALATITGLLSTNFSEKIGRIKQNKAVVIFLILYALYIIGLLYSSNITQGFKSVQQKLVLVIIPLLAASSIAFNPQQQQWALRAFVFSNALFTVVCLILNVIEISNGQPNTSINFDPYSLSRFTELHPGVGLAWMQFSYIGFTSPLLSTPSFISIYLSLCIFILFYLQPFKLKYILIAWFAVIILLLASRVGILILLSIGLPILFYDLFKRKFPLRYSSLSFSFIIVFFALILLFPVTRFRVLEEPLLTPIDLPSDSRNWNSINLRVLEWKSGIEGIRSNGITGTGTGDALEVLDTYYNQVDLGIFDHQYLTHNQFIETSLEIGLAGFIALLLCLVVPFIQALKTKHVLLMSVIIMTSLACFSTSFFERARGLTFYVSFVSLFMFTKSNEENGSEA